MHQNGLLVLTYILMADMEQNKKNLFIVGAGGFGRELELWLQLVPKVFQDFKVIGYIDDNINALDDFPGSYKVLGTIDKFDFKKTDYAVISIADPKIKENVYERIKDRARIYTFISHSAIVGDRKKIGEGSVICPNAIVSTNVLVGKCVTVNCGTQLGHDSIIGDFSSFMANVMIGGEVTIANRVYFGSQSALVPHKKICDDVKICAGTIVIGNIRKTGVYFGNPSKLLYT
jgi:sugar O-acyltransferase (sialic acid O-acetyltransferase NeuD family)